MLAHYEECIRARGEDLMMAMQAANASHMDDKSRAGLINAIRALQQFTFEAAESVYDRMDPGSRILAIGSAIDFGGEPWSESHPDQINWLISQGVTPDESVKRFKAWHDQRRSDPRWRPARSTSRSAGQAST